MLEMPTRKQRVPALARHHAVPPYPTLAHLQDVGAAAQCGEGGGHGARKNSQGVVRRQHAGHLPRQPEGHELRDGQHLRARPKRIPAGEQSQRFGSSLHIVHGARTTPAQ
jgi:hypothetical protein